jgi:hypothetical protein
MLRCAVESCRTPAKSLSGLASHVNHKHPELGWKGYGEKYPIDAEYVSNETEPKEPQQEELSEDMVKRIAKEVVSMMQTETAEPPLEKLPPKGITPLPMEEVEVAKDRINVRVALNPLIYSRLMKFKAANLDLARNDSRLKFNLFFL